jgi:hypothetical protein
MRTLIRVIAGLNAAFQVLVGLISVASPRTAAGLFKVEIASVALLALIRMFGGLLAASGIISGVIAKDPDESRGFLRAYAACLLLNVGADVAVISAGEMQFSQLASGMVLELVLALLILAYPAKKGVLAG